MASESTRSPVGQINPGDCIGNPRLPPFANETRVYDGREVPKLHEIYLYITGRCNLRCAHCWISAGEIGYVAPELTTDEIKRIIDQAMPFGLEALKVTGGEPWLRNDLLEILRYADSLGLRTRTESNGTYIIESVADELAKLRQYWQCISLDGFRPETHAILRGTVKSYFAARRALELLAERGVATEIITVLHRANLPELEDIAGLADSLGCRVWKINQTNDIGRGSQIQSLALSIREVLEVNRLIDTQLRPRHRVAIYPDVPIAFRSIETIRLFPKVACGIHNILGVLADGRLSTCGAGFGMEDLVFASIRHTTVAEVWVHNPALEAVRRAVLAKRDGVCQRCIMQPYCVTGYCRALTYNHTRSLTAPYPFCQESYEAGLFPQSRLLEPAEPSTD